IDSDALMGCMLARMSFYPYTSNPADVLLAQQENQKNLMYTDVQARGEYPNFIKRFFKENSIELDIKAGDFELLRDYPVDYISFSYYMSMTVSARGSVEETGGKLGRGVRSTYIEASDWSWQIERIGLRDVLNDMWDRYQKPLLIIENGPGAYEELTEYKKVYDDYRIDYLKKHI